MACKAVAQEFEIWVFGPPVVFLQGVGAACKKIGCVRLLMYLEDYSLLLLGSRANMGAAYAVAPRKCS